MHYREAVSYFLSLGNELLTMKLGLDNITLLLKKLNLPREDQLLIQIAGTNGKGSTSVMLDSICRAAGYSVGLFTSPHLFKIEERVQIAGSPISEEQFASLTADIITSSLKVNEESGALPTFFEQITALGLLAFSRSGVQVGILETGLGGRLDATTAAKAPLQAITPISLDHTEYLGTTLEQIAAEKAGIMRRESITLIAPQKSEVTEVLNRACVEKGSSCTFLPPVDAIRVSEKWGCYRASFNLQRRYKDLLVGLRGAHQATNAMVATAIAEQMESLGLYVPEEAIVSGLKDGEHPGRLELIDSTPPVLLDGCHNQAGAETLAKFLEVFGRRPLTLIFGLLKDKDLEGISEPLFRFTDRLIITGIDSPRSEDPEKIFEWSQKRVTETFKVASLAEAIQLAREITPDDGLITIAGSLYLVGEARHIFSKEEIL
jgi:dihydrofolate synthase / folylpolyglutamate synthase